MRISGVPVGKVKTIEPDKKTGRSNVVIQLDVALRAAALRRQGDPAPEDAAGRDLRRADPGHAEGQGGARGRHAARPRRSPRRSSWTRSTAPSTRRTRRAFQVWMQSQAQAIKGHGRDINDALGNLGPFAEDASDAVDILNRQEGAVRRLISNTGVVFGALTERGDQLRGLIENSNRVFATTAARDRELQADLRRAADVRARVAHDAQPPRQVRQGHRPARHAAAPGGARAEPDADRPVGARARPQGALPRPRQADHGLAHGLPGRRADPRRPAAAARPGRPGAAPGDPDPRVPRRLQGRADRVLRQHRGGDAGLRPRHAPALPAHDEPAQPREPRGVSAPHRLQPARTRTSCRAATASSRSGLEVYETRHCGRARADDLDRRRPPGADAVPGAGLPVPTLVPVPTSCRPRCRGITQR